MTRFNIFNADVVEHHDGQWVKYDEAQARIEKLEKALKEIADKTKDSLFHTFEKVNEIANQALRNDE